MQHLGHGEGRCRGGEEQRGGERLRRVAASAMATPPRAKAAESGSEEVAGRPAVVVPKRARGTWRATTMTLLRTIRSGARPLRCVARVSDPQGQADLEHRVVEEEDRFGGDVGEIGAVAPGAGRRWSWGPGASMW